ncbi:MAG: hypothetical protein ACOYZ7_01210 [Chloroflexota bacterium]
MAKVTVAFSCDTERDADLLAWRDRQDNLSAAIRAAIRASWLHELTLGDVINELGEIKRLLRNGVTVATGDPAGDDELTPAQAAAQAALDGLGL